MLCALALPRPPPPTPSRPAPPSRQRFSSDACPDYLRTAFVQFPSRVAICDVKSSQVTTFGELWRQSGRLAHRLRRELDTRHADRPRRVVITSPPGGAAFARALVATWRARATAVPLLSEPANEAAERISDSEAPIVLGGVSSASPLSSGFAARASRGGGEEKGNPIYAAVSLPAGVQCFDDAEQESISSAQETRSDAGDGLSSASSCPLSSLDDDAVIIFTSGTTSRPKGCVHTHRSIGAMVSRANCVSGRP